LDRLQNFLKRHEYEGMTDDAFRSIADEEKMAVLNAMKIAERKPKPSLDKLFEDVYQEMPSSLKAQKQQLEEHIAKYPTQYKVGGH
jgi:2-oxoisovalerate dehydrogenase E1 component alpha subunit